MSAGSEQRFDPRFDPAFQPGFDPALPPRSDPTFPPRFAGEITVHQPVARAIQPDAKPVVTSPDPAVAPGLADLSASTEFDGPAATKSSTNPYLPALWAISLVLVVAGAALVGALPEIATQLQRTAAPDAFFYSVQALVVGAPLLIALGIAVAIALLFVRALRGGAQDAH